MNITQRLSVRSALAALYALSLLLVAASAIQASQPSPAEPIEAIVRGIFSRSQAFFSGKLEYRQTTFEAGKQVPFKEPEERSLVFSGTSWICRPKSEKGPIEASHRGKYVIYTATKQPDGSINHGAQVMAEKPINFQYMRHPIFAGTFWYKEPADYIQANLAKGAYLGEKEINGIKTQLMEWRVPATDRYKAFGAVGPITEHGGLLRIYTAPQLGYALPRYEYFGTQGKLSDQFDSLDFAEAAPGLFVPRRCEARYYGQKGEDHQVVFEILKLDSANEPIPDEAFKIYLPDGTDVVYGVDGTGAITFKVKPEGAMPLEGLEDIIGVGSPQSFWRKNAFTAIASGAALGITVLLIGIYLRKRRHSRVQSSS